MKKCSIQIEFSMKFTAFIFCLLVSFLCGFSVTAKSDTIDTMFDKANELFDRHDYINAIKEYKNMLEVASLPNDKADIYYNIAACYENLSNYTSAKEYYEKYLNEMPNAEDKEKVNGIVQKLDSLISKEQLSNQTDKKQEHSKSKRYNDIQTGLSTKVGENTYPDSKPDSSKHKGYIELGYWKGKYKMSEQYSGNYKYTLQSGGPSGNFIDGRNESSSQTFPPFITARILLKSKLSLVAEYSKSNNGKVTHDLDYTSTSLPDVIEFKVLGKTKNIDRKVLGIRYELNGGSYVILSYQNIKEKDNWTNDVLVNGVSKIDLVPEFKNGYGNNDISGVRLGYGWCYDTPKKRYSYGAEIHYILSGNMNSTMANIPPTSDYTIDWKSTGTYTLNGKASAIDVDYRFNYKISDNVKAFIGYRAMKIKLKNGVYNIPYVTQNEDLQSFNIQLAHYEEGLNGFLMGLGYDF